MFFEASFSLNNPLLYSEKGVVYEMNACRDEIPIKAHKNSTYKIQMKGSVYFIDNI